MAKGKGKPFFLYAENKYKSFEYSSMKIWIFQITIRSQFYIQSCIEDYNSIKIKSFIQLIL